ncbi:MAG: hypothetical protein M3Q07_19910 [Pseudobdellovibrionaceae bacterium]|nr:hypothetical protein [Pseudobdellovibrionaceae bacterium]
MAHPITTYLGDLVKRHILSENLAIKSFSREVGVPYMIVYRLTMGSQKSISFFHAKRLLKQIDPQNYLKTLERYFPQETNELLSKNSEVEDSSDEFLELVEFAFGDFDNYRVYAFATECLGARRDDVASEFGRLGLEILDELIKRKAIAENKDGTFSTQLSEFNFWSEELALKVCENNVRLFSSAVPGSYIRNWIVGLNAEGLRKYYEAHTGFVESLKNIEMSPSLRGDKVVSSSVLIGRVHVKKEDSCGGERE